MKTICPVKLSICESWPVTMKMWCHVCCNHGIYMVNSWCRHGVVAVLLRNEMWQRQNMSYIASFLEDTVYRLRVPQWEMMLETEVNTLTIFNSLPLFYYPSCHSIHTMEHEFYECPEYLSNTQAEVERTEEYEYEVPFLTFLLYTMWILKLRCLRGLDINQSEPLLSWFASLIAFM